MMKRLLSALIRVVFLFQLSIVCFAHSETNTVFSYQMGEETIQYYLDSDQNPYIIEDGKKYISRCLCRI